MANDTTAPRPFDVQTVEFLIGLMGKHELTEISLQEGDQKIRLRKGGAPVMVAAPAAPPSYAAPAPSAPPAASAPAKKYHEIKSEMVGTFYARPKPDKDPFVKVGQVIKPETLICQIEAMKIFNEIKAECAGTVVEICVNDKDPVDFGMVLFRIDAS